jgi:bifunctional DNA-binding transcriptional regulator/antitoxin component of YhaV-PrlF toxin-antitoxin module
MNSKVVTVTRKGQATIPKAMRERHKIEEKALAVDVDEGVLLKPLPKPAQDRGSLRHLLRGRTARELLAENRSKDLKRERELLERSL